jgi:putative tryptophan/tyrosine transport system ATP-binding protein
MLQITNAYKTFKAPGGNNTTALKGVSLDMKPADFIILLGGNGSGKSTLLNAIAGNIILDKGTIHINNNDVSKLQDFERSKYISRVFQNPMHGTASNLSIEENFRLAALRTQNKNLKTGLDATFKDIVKQKVETLGLGLENKTSQAIGLLSGGQRQALTLLMATISKPKLLLMDEPTAALDPRSAEIVINTAKKIIDELQLTTILVTHRMKDAIEFGNRIVFLNEGSIEKNLNQEEKQKISLTQLAEWF